MMNRRGFLQAVSAGLLSAPCVAEAQQARKTQRIGVLVAGSSSVGRHFLDAFQRRLSDLGYIEGQQFVIEVRWGEGRTELFPCLVAELTQLKVDVLVVGSDAGALAAKNAATSLPVVFTGVSDPVGLGLVSSLGRPGGHMTGVALAWDAAFAGKWVELLKEIAPGVSRFLRTVTRARSPKPVRRGAVGPMTDDRPAESGRPTDPAKHYAAALLVRPHIGPQKPHKSSPRRRLHGGRRVRIGRQRNCSPSASRLTR